jgi:uncharacterized damage-inducible protein DinB
MATAKSVPNELTNREFFIRRWEQEYSAFRHVLNALPANRLDFRPEPRARSAGELAALLVGIAQAGIDLCDKGEIRWEDPASVRKLGEMVKAYERSHEELGKRLREMNEATWNKPAQCWEHGHVEIEDTIGGLLWLFLFDAVHHRGQLSTYIRPMGGRVPSIYGATADDPSAKCPPVGLCPKVA